MGATAEGRGRLPVAWLWGGPEIGFSQQHRLCRDAEAPRELDWPAVEVPLTPGTPACPLSLQDVTRRRRPRTAFLEKVHRRLEARL